MHTRLPSLLTIVAALLVLASLPAAAQPQTRVSIDGQPRVAPMPRDRPLPREGTAVLKGRVVDGLTGDAIRRARVRLMGPAGRRPLVLTDDAGMFTFEKLPAGPYGISVDKATYLTARYPGNGRTVRARMQPLLIREGETPRPVTIPLYRSGAISGRVLDAHGDPLEHAAVQVLRVPSSGRGKPMQQGGTGANDIGEFRIGRLEAGKYLLLANGRPMREFFSDEAPAPRPLPTYYPGVLSIDEAQSITVERGQWITGLDLTLLEGVPTVVSGYIVNPDGTPFTGDASVNARHTSEFGGLESGFVGGPRPPGTFRMQLAPGEYVLEAHAMQPPPGQQPREEFERYGAVRVSVGSAPLEVTIVIGGGATATGRVVFEGTTPPPSTVPQGFRLPLNSNDGSVCRSGSVRVNEDWTFRVEGLIGTCSAPLQRSFGPWTLKSVLVDGEDLLKRTVTFEPGQRLRNLQVVFTDRRTAMRFQVADEAGQPTRDYVAIVFPTDKSLWKPPRFARTYVPPPLRFAAMSSVEPGRMPRMPRMANPRPEMLPSLPPGEYYAVAVDDIEATPEVPEEVLERLIPSAIRVIAAEGMTTDVSLRRIKFSDGQ